MSRPWKVYRRALKIIVVRGNAVVIAFMAVAVGEEEVVLRASWAWSMLYDHVVDFFTLDIN